MVTSPEISNKSLTEKGNPANGEGAMPDLRRSSEAFAATRAASPCSLR